MFRVISIAGQSHGNECLKNEVVIFAIFFTVFFLVTRMRMTVG